MNAFPPLRPCEGGFAYQVTKEESPPRECVLFLLGKVVFALQCCGPTLKDDPPSIRLKGGLPFLSSFRDSSGPDASNDFS